jgi:head-tail adaptor
MTQFTFEQLKHRVIFQIPISKPDKYGGFEVTGWEDSIITWAKREQINNLNPQVRSGNFCTQFYRFTIRHNPQVMTSIRIFIPVESRIFFIEAINASPNSQQYLDVIAYEKVKFERRT